MRALLSIESSFILQLHIAAFYTIVHAHTIQYSSYHTVSTGLMLIFQVSCLMHARFYLYIYFFHHSGPSIGFTGGQVLSRPHLSFPGMRVYGDGRTGLPCFRRWKR